MVLSTPKGLKLRSSSFNRSYQRSLSIFRLDLVSHPICFCTRYSSCGRALRIFLTVPRLISMLCHSLEKGARRERKQRTMPLVSADDSLNPFSGCTGFAHESILGNGNLTLFSALTLHVRHRKSCRLNSVPLHLVSTTAGRLISVNSGCHVHRWWMIEWALLVKLWSDYLKRRKYQLIGLLLSILPPRPLLPNYPRRLRSGSKSASSSLCGHWSLNGEGLSRNWKPHLPSLDILCLFLSPNPWNDFSSSPVREY